jgi:hypothetical protein
MRTTANQSCKKASDDFMIHEEFYVISILGLLKKAVLWIRSGSTGSRIHIFILKQIRIQRVHPMRIRILVKLCRQKE